MTATTHHIAIAGGGPAGLALALALHKYGQPCSVFDARQRDAGRQDKRTLALSYGSRQTLEWLGVWQQENSIPASPILNIHISQKGGLGRSHISAKEQAVPALGYVLAAADLYAALDKAVTAAGIAVHSNSMVDAAESDGDNVRFTAAGSQHRARLLAFAEGAIEPGTLIRERDYDQHAVICHVGTSTPQPGWAWERFTQHGPVALLPGSTDGKQLAVVYTCPASESAAIAALDEPTFLALLGEQIGHRLRFTSATARLVFPLGLKARQTTIAPRQVWLGNAAQTLHPVAGQGYNLALRDIRDLARTVAEANNGTNMGDPGSSAVLEHYNKRRKLDRASTIGFTDSLVRLFSNDHPLLHHARGAGLLALDLFPPARRFVADRMIFGTRAF